MAFIKCQYTNGYLLTVSLLVLAVNTSFLAVAIGGRIWGWQDCININNKTTNQGDETWPERQMKELNRRRLCT